jgi:hypothetical protein
MLPTINDFVRKFDLKDFVTVAGSGLMNRENIAELEQNGYKCIVSPYVCILNWQEC